jgi:hypothetical protein
LLCVLAKSSLYLYFNSELVMEVKWLWISHGNSGRFI